MNETLVVKIRDMIGRTMLSLQKYKSYDIFGANESSVCINNLEEINNELLRATTDEDVLIITKTLGSIFKTFGTENMSDFLCICFPQLVEQYEQHLKLHSILKYVHPIGYKCIIEEKKIDFDEKELNCNQPDGSCSFQNKVQGITFMLPHKDKWYMIYGLVDDILLSTVQDKYLNNKYIFMKALKNDTYSYEEMYEIFLYSLTIKDYFLNSSSVLLDKYKSIKVDGKQIKKKHISVTIKDFISFSLFEQRNCLIKLLIHTDTIDFQYLAYLLYDLLSSEQGENIDTHDQTMLYDSLPWGIKKEFKKAMKSTIGYTKQLYQLDENKVPLEQQICLLSTTDNVKEKAMQKLTEVKAKTDDQGTKARQYLDGLLKIPFNIYNEEPVLVVIKQVRQIYKKLFNEEKNISEIKKHVDQMTLNDWYTRRITILKECLIFNNRGKLIDLIKYINTYVKQYKIYKLSHSTRKIENMTLQLNVFFDKYLCHPIIDDVVMGYHLNLQTKQEIETMKTSLLSYITTHQILMKDIDIQIENSVHGHKDAKRQIERIIAQWINGENKRY